MGEVFARRAVTGEIERETAVITREAGRRKKTSIEEESTSEKKIKRFPWICRRKSECQKSKRSRIFQRNVEARERLLSTFKRRKRKIAEEQSKKKKKKKKKKKPKRKGKKKKKKKKKKK